MRSIRRVFYHAFRRGARVKLEKQRRSGRRTSLPSAEPSPANGRHPSIEIEQIFDFLLDKFEHLLYILIRRSLKNGNMHNGEELFHQTNTIFRGNTGCISRKIGAVCWKKDRRLGVLTFFKQALGRMFSFAPGGIVRFLGHILVYINLNHEGYGGIGNADHVR